MQLEKNVAKNTENIFKKACETVGVSFNRLTMTVYFELSSLQAFRSFFILSCDFHMCLGLEFSGHVMLCDRCDWLKSNFLGNS